MLKPTSDLSRIISALRFNYGVSVLELISVTTTETKNIVSNIFYYLFSLIQSSWYKWSLYPRYYITYFINLLNLLILLIFINIINLLIPLGTFSILPFIFFYAVHVLCRIQGYRTYPRQGWKKQNKIKSKY